MDNFIGEIRMFAGPYAPENWHMCDGSLLSVSQNQTLFNLLGVQYGGDGVNTFGIPDLRGRAPVHKGTGTGLTPVTLGQKAGTETVILTTSNMPPHIHTLNAVNTTATQTSPGLDKNMMLAATTNVPAYVDNTTSPPTGAMNQSSMGYAGSNVPVSIMQPSFPINFIIALNGIYPTQN